MTRLFPLMLLATAVSCAPRAAAPTQLTTTARYTTGIPRAGEDNLVLAAIVAIAPTAPVTSKNRQPWRAEDIQTNSVVLRSRPTTMTSAFTLANYPQEMSWNVIATGGVTTVTATHSSAYAATVQVIFDQLDKRFTRAK